MQQVKIFGTRTRFTHYLLMPRPWDDKSGYLRQAGFELENGADLRDAVIASGRVRRRTAPCRPRGTSGREGVAQDDQEDAPRAVRETLATHLLEAKAHVERLERVFAAVGEKPKGRRCEGMAGIVAESKSAMKEDFDEATMDACVVAAAQRVGHYQMAAYGTLTLWARTLGHRDAMALLAATLAEEKAASERLSSLADLGPHALAAGPDGQYDAQNTGLTTRLKTSRTKK